jgi:glycosyltransferase involved in cell wall biosynthesis
MKINIITYNNQYGLTNDLKLLKHFFERHFKDRVQIRPVNFFDFRAPEADINIFLETVSNILFKHAKYNILIPNQEWYYRTWIPYVNSFDLILTKSHYATNIFKSIKKDQDSVKYLGWKSLDRSQIGSTKDYNQFLHVCGRSKHKQTQEIIDAWEQDFPTLHVIYSPRDVPLVQNKLDNIKYYTERLEDNELEDLANTCGVHICCSETEGYGHYIHEAKSCGAIVITTQAPPMETFISPELGFLVKTTAKKQLKKHLGSRFVLDQDDFKRVIREIMGMDKAKLKEMGYQSKSDFNREAKKFSDHFKEIFTEIFKKVSEIKKEAKTDDTKKEEMKEMMNDENLPKISIITPTYKRQHMFKLAVTNINNMIYPDDKWEWIIVDDSPPSTESETKIYQERGIKEIADILPKDDDRIKYFKYDEKMPVGKKRNLCIEKASNDIIVCMDDDDYYPPNSFKLRVLELLNNKDKGKRCVFCSTIGCFHINKLNSMINVPPHKLPLAERASEASMCFYKDFWEEQKFKDESSLGEAKGFLSGREDQVHEISWVGVLVACLHNRNTSDKIIVDDTPNGNHFGWSDSLFLFITNLDIELTPEEEEARKKMLEDRERVRAKNKKEDYDAYDGHLD